MGIDNQKQAGGRPFGVSRGEEGKFPTGNGISSVGFLGQLYGLAAEFVAYSREFLY